ncbi:hypothetical protein ACFU7X_40985 [Streptomyces chartreusis]|uniref:hypothetical protein n=1 Tax=Streptomyces chartreusis TaxID=1969 RepID=UPI0036C4E236
MNDLPHSDYRGNQLAVGDSIAFITSGVGDVPVLVTGRIVLTRDTELCVESGQLVVLRGAKVGGNSFQGGKPLNPDRIRHAIVHRISEESET